MKDSGIKECFLFDGGCQLSDILVLAVLQDLQFGDDSRVHETLLHFDVICESDHNVCDCDESRNDDIVVKERKGRNQRVDRRREILHNLSALQRRTFLNEFVQSGQTDGFALRVSVVETAVHQFAHYGARAHQVDQRGQIDASFDEIQQHIEQRRAAQWRQFGRVE